METRFCEGTAGCPGSEALHKENMMKTNASCVLSFILVMAACGVARSDIELPKLISDGMVLQADKGVAIWGTAEAGSRVSVSFAGQEVSTEAGAEGSWKLRLAPLEADATPREMTIRDREETVTIKDVQVGEVWIAGGQSNMWYPLAHMNNREDQRKDADALENVRFYRALGGYHPDVWDRVDYERALNVSAVCYFFMTDMAKAFPGIPIAVIDTSVCASWAESWMSKEALEAYNADPDHALKIDIDGSGYGDAPASRPAYWYEEIMTRTFPYGARGVLWYQGEGNVMRPKQYETLLAALIRNWRDGFEQPDLTFLICQLPPKYNKTWDPQRESWAYFREAQFHVSQNVPNTGLVVAPECGAAGNIHPRHKDEFGQRLALAARAIAYGEDIVFSGPIYRSKETAGDRIILHFDHVGSGLVSKDGGALKQFEVCGEDGRFVPAQARIVGDTVVVSSPSVTKPVHARYAWTNYPADMTAFEENLARLEKEMENHPEPRTWLQQQLDETYAENADYPVECNLYNAEGLPANPFRTDDFPFPTQ